MKKTSIKLWSMLLIMFTFAACEKAEIAVLEQQAEALAKKSGGGTSGGGTTTTATYGGRATGLDATVWDFSNPTVTSTQQTFADTYFLPASGGSVSRSEPQATIQGVLTTGALSASITGQNNSTVSEASVSTLYVTTGGHVISADYLQATATAGCGSALSVSSQVTNLVVNGQSIVVTGAANQTIYFPNGGMIIINERSTSKKGGGINGAALHILIPNVSDVKVAPVSAQIKC